MIGLSSLLFSALVAGVPPSELNDRDDTEFGYYMGEFLTYAMPDDEPMANLITHRLVDTLFDSRNQKVFDERLMSMKTYSEKYPELLLRFEVLDDQLKTSLSSNIKESISKKYIYAAGGAVVGLLVGIPVGSALASHTTMGSRVLWLTIPAGALVGAGAGYLLGGLLSRESIHEFNSSSSDLGLIEDLSKQ